MTTALIVLALFLYALSGMLGAWAFLIAKPELRKRGWIR